MSREKDAGVCAKLVEREHRDDLLAILEIEHVDDRTTLRGARALGQLEHLLVVDAALIGEQQQVIVGRRHEHVGDKVTLRRGRAGDAATAAALRRVLASARALDIAKVAARDHGLFFVDQLLGEDLTLGVDDLGATRIRELVAQRLELRDDRGHEVLIVAEQALEIIGERPQLFVFGFELFALEAGEATEPHVEDRLRLAFGEEHEALGVRGIDFGRRATGALEEAAHTEQLLLHQGVARDVGVLRGADDLDHAIDVHHGEAQALDDLAARSRFAQVEQGATRDDLAAVIDEDLERLAQGQHHRATVDDREHVRRERCLQRRELEQIVEDDLVVRIALELEHDPDAVAIRGVGEVGDALELLVDDERGGLRDPALLVHHERQLGHHDREAILADLLGVSDAAQLDRTATRLVRGEDAAATLDHASGREIGTGNELEQLLIGELRIGDQRERAIDDLTEVVRRDVRRHTDGDAGAAVDQEVRNLRRQDGRLELLVVVVRLPIDGLFVDVGEHLAGEPAHPALGVAVGGRWIAIDRAEVALAVDEHVAHREVLSHADERVVDRRIAMRVILADDVADDARALHVRPVPRVVQHALGEQDAAVHRL